MPSAASFTLRRAYGPYDLRAKAGRVGGGPNMVDLAKAYFHYQAGRNPYSLVACLALIAVGVVFVLLPSAETIFLVFTRVLVPSLVSNAPS